MAEMLLVNPRKRRRRRKTTARRRNPRKRTYTRRRSPARRRRRSYRRNPVRMTGRNIQGHLMNSFTGASGALLLDIAWGYLPVPANLKAGYLGYLVRGIGALGLGMLAQGTRLVRPATAVALAEGGMTVALHDALKDGVRQFAPQVKLGEYLDDFGVSSDHLGYAGSGYNPGGGVGMPQLSPMTEDDLTIDQSGLGEYMDADYGYGI